MKKLYLIITLLLFSQFQVFSTFADSDGEVEISSKKIVNK